MDIESKRKPNRINGYDYSADGAYFLTICAKDRKEYFSVIAKLADHAVGETIGLPPCDLAETCNNAVKLTDYGRIVDDAIKKIPQIYPSLSVDCYVIMPDHIHLILRIVKDEDGRPMVSPTVSRVVSQLKCYVTKHIGFSVWQRSFYDHVIRNKQDYDECVRYIYENPIKWVYVKTEKSH